MLIMFVLLAMSAFGICWGQQTEGTLSKIDFSFYFLQSSNNLRFHDQDEEKAVRIWLAHKQQLVAERAPKTEVQTGGWGWAQLVSHPTPQRAFQVLQMNVFPLNLRNGTGDQRCIGKKLSSADKMKILDYQQLNRYRKIDLLNYWKYYWYRKLQQIWSDKFMEG